MAHYDSGLRDAARARDSIRGTGTEERGIDNPMTNMKEVVRTYGWYLRKYVSDARGKIMTPVIVSPVIVSPVPRCPHNPVAKGDVEKNCHVAPAEEVVTADKWVLLPLNKKVTSKHAAFAPADIKSMFFAAANGTHTSPAGAGPGAACVSAGSRGLAECEPKGHLLPVGSDRAHSVMTFAPPRTVPFSTTSGGSAAALRR